MENTHILVYPFKRACGKNVVMINTQPYVWRDLFVCMIWYEGPSIGSDYAPMPRRNKASRLSHMCDMTQSYVWHDSVIRVTWLIRTYDLIRGSVVMINTQKILWAWALFVTSYRNMTDSYVWLYTTSIGSDCAPIPRCNKALQTQSYV